MNPANGPDEWIDFAPPSKVFVCPLRDLEFADDNVGFVSIAEQGHFRSALNVSAMATHFVKNVARDCQKRIDFGLDAVFSGTKSFGEF